MLQSLNAKFGCVANRVCGLWGQAKHDAVCLGHNTRGIDSEERVNDDAERSVVDDNEASNNLSAPFEPVSRVYTIIAQWCKVSTMCSMTYGTTMALTPIEVRCQRKKSLVCTECSPSIMNRSLRDDDVVHDDVWDPCVFGGERGDGSSSPRRRWKRENASRRLDEYFYNLVMQLVEEGETVNYSDFAGYTPLMLACANRHHKAIRLLIKLGSDVNIRNQEGATALMLSSACDDVTTIKTLVNADADLDVMDCHEQTALMEASVRGGDNVVRALVESGADTNLRDSRGRTALHLAILHGHYAVAHCLVNFGMCDINAQDADGYSALYLAAWNPGFDHPLKSHSEQALQAVELVDRLVEKGADVDSVDQRDMVCLVRAWNHKPVVRALIRNGACVNHVVQVGKNKYPLPLVAALEGDSDMVLLLSQAGYDTSALLSSVFLVDERHSKIVSELTQIFSTPLSLKAQSRLVIRRRCGNVKLKCKLAFLPLPAAMVEYLLFQEGTKF